MMVAVRNMSGRVSPRRRPGSGKLVEVWSVTVACAWTDGKMQLSRRGMDAGQRRRFACCVEKLDRREMG